MICNVSDLSCQFIFVYVYSLHTMHLDTFYNAVRVYSQVILVNFQSTVQYIFSCRLGAVCDVSTAS